MNIEWFSKFINNYRDCKNYYENVKLFVYILCLYCSFSLKWLDE